MKRRRRKLNARLSALRQHNPNSQNIARLTTEVNNLTYNIQEAILKDLAAREEKAVSTIKSNPKYFFSYIDSTLYCTQLNIFPSFELILVF